MHRNPLAHQVLGDFDLPALPNPNRVRRSDGKIRDFYRLFCFTRFVESESSKATAFKILSINRTSPFE
ncbi:MAG TPA: hypothetical protein V6C65_27535 [Allocoleopsis sp.]